MKNVVILDHPLVSHKITLLRDKNTNSKQFRELVEEISMLITYESLRNLPTEEIEVETPICKTRSKVIAGKDIAIVNVLKCRPPRNRDPLPEEAAACAAFLDRQLELLAPKVIVLLGRQAMQRMLHRTEKLDALRGRTFSLSIAGREVPVVVTYHPSSLLRNPVDKEKGWHDFLFAKSVLAKALLDQPQAAAATS